MSYFKSTLIRNTMLLLLVVLASCTTVESDRNYNVFSNYLHSEFNLKLPKKELKFLVVPGQGCSHCSNGTVKLFSEVSPDIENLYLVVNSSFYKDSLENIEQPRVLIDHSGKISRIDLGYSSPMLISSKNSKVQTISEISIYNLDSLKTVFQKQINN